MVFSSLVFICIFLPAVWLLQLILPSIRLKNAALLAASLLFYAYGEPVYVLLLLVSAVLNWAAALLISRKVRGVLPCAVLINVALLVVFKYAGFLVSTANALFHTGFPVPDIPLPIGISFYTFQAMSYVIDVKRGDCRARKNFFDLLLYISFFPQLIAGPIVRYRDIERELTERHISTEDTAAGIRRFICGLGKKVLIANYCGAIADTLYAAPIELIRMPSAWLAAIAYLMQIYFDFSGYSDMAIGMGRMFGFHFLENFKYPYTASSITDFWRRWHISLSTWLREYLYIPLGGNRKGKARTIINRFIVFLTCGIWHGANLTFLFWGFYHGLLLMAESLFRGRKKSAGDGPDAGGMRPVRAYRLRRILGHVYTLAAVTVGFVFFRADTIRQGFAMAGRMFLWSGGVSGQARVLLWSVLTPAGIAALLAGAAACLPVRQVFRGRKRAECAVTAASLVCFALCILNLAGGTYNPFIYFRF